MYTPISALRPTFRGTRAKYLKLQSLAALYSHARMNAYAIGQRAPLSAELKTQRRIEREGNPRTEFLHVQCAGIPQTSSAVPELHSRRRFSGIDKESWWKREIGSKSHEIDDLHGGRRPRVVSEYFREREFIPRARKRENEVENACAEVVGGYFCAPNGPRAAVEGRKNVNF